MIKRIEFENYRMCYQMTTYGGQSGTAVLYGDKLVAIHKGSGRKSEEFNFGRIISLEMAERLVEWSI
jgi:hypothetical protein